MKTTTFEQTFPIRDVSPQWINFIHRVNDLAVEAGQAKPFGNPIKEIDRGHYEGPEAEYVSDIGIEIYAECLIVHTKKAERTIAKGYRGVTTFVPQSSRVRALLAQAAPEFSEANVTSPADRDIGAYYTEQRTKIEALEILAEYLEDQGEVPHIERVRRNLEAARVID
jgi:hypothetical protein